MGEKKQYDLEDRTLRFARSVSKLVNSTSRTLSNVEYCKQVIRSAGSVGANYIEANEALSKKDFVMRIKICRKEAKESRYWLSLITCSEEAQSIQKMLLQESMELTKIFGAILEKSK